MHYVIGGDSSQASRPHPYVICMDVCVHFFSAFQPLLYPLNPQKTFFPMLSDNVDDNSRAARFKNKRFMLD